MALTGCKTADDSLATGSAAGPLELAPAAPPPPPDPIGFTDAAPAETFRLGLQHFHRDEFGLAERYLRATVEKQPENAAAWIALAATYDRIRRFDFADRAYRMAIRLSGETVQILNNQGFSYMLRGDFRTAMAKFKKAYRMDPGNPTIANNIRILESREIANRDDP